MSQSNSDNDFDILLEVAVPLISNHNEPDFDMLLSRWMGKYVHEEYVKWKDSIFVTELSRGDQIRCLLTMWRKHVGDVANVGGFINLLQRVQGVNSTFKSGPEKYLSTKKISTESCIEYVEYVTDDVQLNEYAIKIQSAYRGYQVRKNNVQNQTKVGKSELIRIKGDLCHLTEEKKVITCGSDDWMINTCATKVQNAYRDYRNVKINEQFEAGKVSVSTLETSQLPQNTTQILNYPSKDMSPSSNDTILIESAIKIQRAYRSYHTRQMYKKVKQAIIICKYPDCMSNVLQEKTETIERFYRGYQTKQMYKKWKNAALAIQSFYRIKKERKRLFDKKKENKFQLYPYSSDKLKSSGCSYATFLIFFAASFFLASFIISCLFISTCHINKTQHHIF